MTLRLVSTCRCRKSSWLSLSRTGMALWLGAKIETIYVPKSPRWTAMKSSACRGSSTQNSRPRYSARCAQIVTASTSVLFAFFRSECAEEPAMDGDEEQRLQRFQHPEQQTQVQREVCTDRHGFDQRTLRLLRGEELDAAA